MKTFKVEFLKPQSVEIKAMNLEEAGLMAKIVMERDWTLTRITPKQEKTDATV